MPSYEGACLYTLYRYYDMDYVVALHYDPWLYVFGAVVVMLFVPFSLLLSKDMTIRILWKAT